MTEPALYVGRLRHRRFRPREHAFTYRLFMALVDIDHAAEQMRVSPFTSVNRFNWASFDDSATIWASPASVARAARDRGQAYRPSPA